MTNVFVHIGDMHIQSTNTRNGDRLRALDQIIDETVTLEWLAAYLIPGDIFHARSTAADRNDVAARLQRMGAHAPVLLCAGNHDGIGDLTIFGKLKTAWPIIVVLRPEVVSLPLATGATAAVFVLPYPTRSGLVAAGTPVGAVVDTARSALDTIFISAAAQLAERTAVGEIPLMVAHVNVSGSISSSGQPSIGQEIELDQAILARLGHMYKGLSHIHKPQRIGDAYYAGSICRMDFGECEEKFYNLIEYREDDAAGEYHVSQQPIDVAPMYRINGELSRDGFSWTCDDGGYAEQAGPGFFTGADVRVRFTFAAVEKSLLNFELVKAPFVGARRLELDPVAIRDRATRAPEVMAATTLDDKVKAFVTSAGQQWTDGLERKLAALQLADGAAFLTQVSGDKA